MTARDPVQAGAAVLAAEKGLGLPVRLPVIRVRTEQGEVAAFRRETGSIGTGDFVPLTFPFRWLALSAIRGVILQLLGGEGFVPVQEAQSFVYERDLQIATDYLLSVEIEAVEKPRRLILKMAVATEEGEICARLETVLRIVQLTSEMAS